MKKLLFIFFLSSPLFAFCQQAAAPLFSLEKEYRLIDTPGTREHLLAKSKSQRSAAFILLGVGALGIAIAAPGNVSFDVLGTIVVVSGLSILGSVPLFIAAGKNKRRAERATALFRMESISAPTVGGMTVRTYPALGIKINLR